MIATAEPVTITSSPDSLRTLNVKPAGEHFRILIATDPRTMRGFDYRGHERGLTLVIDRSFESHRDASQGLARVGRFGEKCERYATYKTELVDATAIKVQATRLLEF